MIRKAESLAPTYSFRMREADQAILFEDGSIKLLSLRSPTNLLSLNIS